MKWLTHGGDHCGVWPLRRGRPLERARFAGGPMDISQSLQNMMNTIMNTLPTVVVFVVILVVGWLIARLIRRLVLMGLEKVHFERMAERGVIGDTLSRSEYTASGLIAALAYYTVLLITLQMAFGVFGPNPISNLLSSIVHWLPNLIVAVILVVVASAIATVVKNLIATALGAVSYGKIVANLASIFIIAVGVIAALNQVGIAATVTEPILITVLATVGAILAIGVGGGMIRPMQQRWERMLTAAESETGKLQTAAKQRGREDALRGGQMPAEEGMAEKARGETRDY